jgi:hypothetical protein
MRRTSARLAVTLAAALIACGVIAASAFATYLPGGTSNARFKVTVKGVQTTTWTTDHKSAFRCDPASKGSGTEKVKFASSKVAVIRAFRVGHGPVLFVRGTGQPDLPTRGYVERHGTLTLAPSDPSCEVGDGGGGSGPAASDCGRKKISSLPLRLQYDPLNAKRITLSNGTIPKSPQFTTCPGGRVGWTTILSRDDRHRTAGESLPARDVFDRHQGKMIVLGKGVVRSNSDGTVSTTKISWELTLTRLKG